MRVAPSPTAARTLRRAHVAEEPVHQHAGPALVLPVVHRHAVERRGPDALGRKGVKRKLYRVGPKFAS